MTGDFVFRNASIELDVGFPLRVACVDMGSNTIRFLAAEFSSETEYEVLASERLPVRLGHGVYLSGRLEATAMDPATEALVGFRRQMDALDREHVQRGTDLTARLGDHELTLWLDGSAGLLLEGWSLKKKAKLFGKIFERTVSLRFLGGEQAMEA